MCHARHVVFVLCVYGAVTRARVDRGPINCRPLDIVTLVKHLFDCLPERRQFLWSIVIVATQLVLQRQAIRVFVKRRLGPFPLVDESDEKYFLGVNITVSAKTVVTYYCIKVRDCLKSYRERKYPCRIYVLRTENMR